MVWWCSRRAVVETADRLIQVIRTYSGAWRLQRLLPGGFGFSPPRLGHLSKALARRGANLSPRFGGGLRDLRSTLFRPSRPLGGSDFGACRLAHFPAFVWRGIGLGRHANHPGEFHFQRRDLFFDFSSPA